MRLIRSLPAIDPLAPVKRMASRRWEILKRDLSTVAGELSGKRASPIVPRKPRIATRPVRVSRIVRETSEAISVYLVDADGDKLDYEAGQFLTLHLSIDGLDLRRAYSLSTSPLDGESAITIKRMGRASSWLNDSLREGMILRVLGPSGSFLAPPPGPRHCVLLAGGSGITPIISIAETILRTQSDQRLTLIYGNRSRDSVIFAERLDRLANARFEVRHVLETEEGLLDRPRIARELDRIESADLPRTYYSCGPAPMMQAARAELLDRGVDPRDIREERFASPQDQLSNVDLPTEPVLVQIRTGDRDHEVRVDPGKTILEAAVASGIAMPFSCAMGGCGACKGKLASGSVLVPEPHCLTDEERAQGYVLTCIGRPRAASVVELPRKAMP
jgi:ring-1,2-phenylacetyl-CoA epoxidase subunit PaaE